MTMPSLRYIAPAGSPVQISDLLASLTDFARPKDAEKMLTEAIATRYGVKHCLAMSSGRAAMALLFDALKELANDPVRNEIVMPAYTCYSVPAAAIAKGLRPRIVDIDPQTLSYTKAELESIDYSKVLAIVTANLYGYPNDLTHIEAIAQANNVFMIDDAAQSMHAKFAGRYVGTFGDAGIYSFDKGKNITSLQGGVIVTQRDDIAQAVNRRIQALPRMTPFDIVRFYLAFTAYVVLLRPWLYWLPANMPLLGLGRTPYTTEIPSFRYHRAAARIASRLFAKIDNITAVRTANAQAIIEKIASIPGLTLIQSLDQASPVYLRLPLLTADSVAKSHILNDLNKAGIGATASYPQSIGCLPEVLQQGYVHNNCIEGAIQCADRIITLPTLHYLNNRDIHTIADHINVISSRQ